MLYFKIKDYSEFKEIFGTCKSPRGTIQNKILLAFWKSRFKRNPNEPASLCKSMTDMYKIVMDQLTKVHNNIDVSNLHRVVIRIKDKEYVFYSSKYKTDGTLSAQGAKDIKCCTVIDVKTKKFCTVKPSKIIIDSFTSVGAKLAPSVITYCAEIFQSQWEAYRQFCLEQYRLVVDSNFEEIYSSERCLGNFGSCMTDRHHTSFFSTYVNAKAAKLIETESGKIVARCIVWNEVKCDKTNKVYSYADRQYASNSDVKLKTLLVERLYEEGYINIHKDVTASCRDSMYISDRTGNRITDPKLSVTCTIQKGGALSYMDTFKYLDTNKGRLYTYSKSSTPYDLSTTRDTF
jgi:hypothetical protein